MKTRSNPVRTGAAAGALAWFLLANGIAFVHDVVLGRAQGAQMGWGTLGCYASILLAPVGAGLGALVGGMIARSRDDAGGSRGGGRGPGDGPA
jgi:hypothetical protein